MSTALTASQGNQISNIYTDSPPIPAHLRGKEPPPLSLSVPVTKSDAALQARRCQEFVLMAIANPSFIPILANVASQFALQAPTSSQSSEPISLYQTKTVKDLYAMYPHLANMDEPKEERLDNEPPTFLTLGPVDAQFIKKMVEQHKMDEKEATVVFYCRKWAQLNGFSLNPL